MSATCEILVDDPDGRIQRLQMPCGKPAVIRYGAYGKDPLWHCKHHVDKNVLELLELAEPAQGFINAGLRSRFFALDRAIAALAPKEHE